MTATFRPKAKGRPVKLQRQQGRRWVNVAQGRQDRRGVVEFTAPYKVKRKIATYRVLAGRYDGLKSVRSLGVKTSQPGLADFTDDFTGTALDATKWGHRLQDYSPVSQRTCSKSDPRAVSVSGGVVRLSVRNDPDRGGLLDPTPKCAYEGKNYEWRINGHIGTEGKHSFKYGYTAARMKFQPRRGQHASFWSMPATQEAGEGSARLTGAEIDVIEWFGENHPQGGLASFIHHWPNDNKEGITSQKVGGWLEKPGQYGGKWADLYHVFSVEWTPKRYVFRIDGQETFRTSKGVSGQEQFLILSLLSSDYELTHLGGDGKLPQTMQVDWVRTWER